ncbi:MAG: hypothetical protein AB4372_31060 [Xenococcus sp. (in: cyanobacteria)]
MRRNPTDNSKKAKRRIFVDSLLIFFILGSPFIFKMHEYVSTDPEATFEFLGMTIDRNGFPNLNVFVWFMLGKIVPLYLLLIWFFTCKHWWYHIILIPILMYAFQIFESVISTDDYIDTENILWLLPFCMVVIPFVYLIRVKLYDKYVHGIDLEAMDAELQYYRDKENNELRKHGITPPSAYVDNNDEANAKSDLSEKLPQSILSKLLGQIRHSFQSIF